MNRKALAAVCVVIVLAVAASAIVIGRDGGGNGGDGGPDTGMYRGYDAYYEYTTSGATSDTYTARLDRVLSSEEVLFVQSALEGYPLKVIGSGALADCSSRVIVLPATVTTMEEGALSDCRAEEIVLLGGMPDGADPDDGRLRMLDVNGGTVPTATVPSDTGDLLFLMYGEGAVLLEADGSGTLELPGSVESPDGTVRPVTMVGCDSFRSSSYTSVVMPSSVERIGTRAFYGCEGLVSVTLPEGLASVEDEAFRHCPALAGIDLGSVSFIGFEAFRECRSLVEVVIPDSVTFLGAGAFYVCSSMERVSVGTGVTSLPDRVFGYGTVLTEVELRGDVVYVGSYAFAMCPILERISLPDAREIGSSAFAECRMLSEVELGSVEALGNSVFSNCRSIASMELPGTLERMGSEVFVGCRSLADLWFGGPMPTMEEDSLLGTDCAVHVPESEADSWEGFPGELLFYRRLR